MSYDTEIYTAFAAKIDAFADAQSPPLPVAWPGVHFVPPTTGEWLELAWFPNETRNLTLGNDGSQLRGFGQVSCCARPGSGIRAVTDLSGRIIDLFAKGTKLGPTTVERKPWVSTVLPSSDRISAPVTVRYSGGVSS